MLLYITILHYITNEAYIIEQLYRADHVCILFIKIEMSRHQGHIIPKGGSKHGANAQYDTICQIFEGHKLRCFRG